MDILNSARALITAARRSGYTITTAESCTGGLLAGAITEIAGASDIFERGFVTYSNAAKIGMLGVLPATLSQFGAVSEQVAIQMAEGARTKAGANLALSITGIAGPGGSEHKPEGRVCFGIAGPGRSVQAETVEFGPIGRAKVRQAAVAHGLAMINAALS